MTAIGAALQNDHTGKRTVGEAGTCAVGTMMRFFFLVVGADTARSGTLLPFPFIVCLSLLFFGFVLFYLVRLRTPSTLATITFFLPVCSFVRFKHVRAAAVQGRRLAPRHTHRDTRTSADTYLCAFTSPSRSRLFSFLLIWLWTQRNEERAGRTVGLFLLVVSAAFCVRKAVDGQGKGGGCGSERAGGSHILLISACEGPPCGARASCNPLLLASRLLYSLPPLRLCSSNARLLLPFPSVFIHACYLLFFSLHPLAYSLRCAFWTVACAPLSPCVCLGMRAGARRACLVAGTHNDTHKAALVLPSFLGVCASHCLASCRGIEYGTACTPHPLHCLCSNSLVAEVGRVVADAVDERISSNPFASPVLSVLQLCASPFPGVHSIRTLARRHAPSLRFDRKGEGKHAAFGARRARVAAVAPTAMSPRGTRQRLRAAFCCRPTVRVKTANCTAASFSTVASRCARTPGHREEGRKVRE